MSEEMLEADQAKTIGDLVWLKNWLKENTAHLKESGVATIEGTYAGSGDEGQFESVSCINAKGIEILDFDFPEEVEDRLRNLVDTEAGGTGYEDGDGGGGAIVLDVQSGKIEHRSYWNEMVAHDDTTKELA